jgi:hypothetical protein
MQPSEMPHSEDFALEHAQVLNEADLIYTQKSTVRGQMWLDYPPSDKLRELRERIDRLDHAYKVYGDGTNPTGEDIREEMVSDAIDMINFAAFFIKQLRRGMHG